MLCWAFRSEVQNELGGGHGFTLVKRTISILDGLLAKTIQGLKKKKNPMVQLAFRP